MTFSNQLHPIDCHDVPTLKRWSYPVSSYKYDLMKIYWDSGTYTGMKMGIGNAC
jgi:hypothetical protein